MNLLIVSIFSFEICDCLISKIFFSDKAKDFIIILIVADINEEYIICGN